ncbi:MAG: O-antigen ligase family protein [Bacteroidota bacterium]
MMNSFFKVALYSSAIISMTAWLAALGLQNLLFFPLNTKEYASLSSYSGIMFHPLNFGTQMLLGFISGIVIKPRRTSLLYYFAMAACLVGLYLSDARGAFVALVIFALLYLSPPKYFMKLKILFLIIPIILCGLFFVGSWLIEKSEFLYSFLRIEAADNSRFMLWAFAYELIKKEPLIGYGFKSSSDLILGSDLPIAHMLDPGVPFHNNYIDVAVESGIIAMVLYLLVFVIPVIRAFKSLRIYPENKVFFAAAMAIFVNTLTVDYNIGGIRVSSFMVTVFLGVANLLNDKRSV